MQFSSCLKAVLSPPKMRVGTVVTPSQLNNVPRSEPKLDRSQLPTKSWKPGNQPDFFSAP